MTTDANLNQEYQPSISKRLLFILLYLCLTVLISIGVAIMITSDRCFQAGRCSEADQIIYAIVAVADFMAIMPVFILGMQCKLPGARARTGA